jgi:gluconokinase
VTRVLALDVGSSSARAAWFDEQAVSGPIEKVEYEPGPELDAAVVRAAVEEAVGRVGGEDAPRAVSCFWHGLLALDSGDAPCSPIYTWLDARAVGQADALRRQLDEAAVHERTGCRLHPTYWPARLLWLREERPEIFARAARFVSIGEFLLDTDATSLSLASGTGLLDRARGAWDEQLLEAIQIGPERLPAIADLPLWGDGGCANVGAGARTRDRACLTVGTSAAYRVAADASLRPSLFRYLLDAATPVVGGALSDGGNVLSWLEETLGASEGTDAEHDLIFLPLLGGERSPGWRASARGAVAGLTLETTPAQIAQAAREGIAYEVAEVADALPGVREVVASGGALHDEPEWLQLFADVLERPVVVTDAEEASLRGAAVLALEHEGIEVPAPTITRSFEPRVERFERHRTNRERLRRLYSATQE